MPYAIAIDGPASAGKSTAAKKLAEKLNLIYIDTGAMYRAVGLYMLRHELDPENEKDAEKAINEVQITFVNEDGVIKTLLNGEAVSGLIRNEKVGDAASACSTHVCVRKKLVEMQKQLAKENDVVMDGRDIGTVVLPDANLKIFLTAAPEERAKRRYRQLLKRGGNSSYEAVLAEIKNRDERDTNRKESPLRAAEGAVVVNNTNMTAEETLKHLLALVAAATV